MKYIVIVCSIADFSISKNAALTKEKPRISHKKKYGVK